MVSITINLPIQLTVWFILSNSFVKFCLSWIDTESINSIFLKWATNSCLQLTSSEFNKQTIKTKYITPPIPPTSQTLDGTTQYPSIRRSLTFPYHRTTLQPGRPRNSNSAPSFPKLIISETVRWVSRGRQRCPAARTAVALEKFDNTTTPSLVMHRRSAKAGKSVLPHSARDNDDPCWTLSLSRSRRRGWPRRSLHGGIYEGAAAHCWLSESLERQFPRDRESRYCSASSSPGCCGDGADFSLRAPGNL